MKNKYAGEKSFSFSSFEKDKNDDLHYDDISGLGESDYENEDLFEMESQTKKEKGNKPKKNITLDEVNEEKDSYEEKINLEEVDKEEGGLDSKNVSKEDDDVFSSTPINELKKLTHFEKENISTTDIKMLFDKVGDNVKEASDIFKKNTEMKEKIDARFEELKQIQMEIEKSKKSQYDEINSYKEEVLTKLTEKKEEIERRLNKLKDIQSNLEKERQEFERYKKEENAKISQVQQEIQDAYESRREELNHIEDVLRKQKDSLDEERSQLSLDLIQYESDKNELANNLLKFNEIVASFTNGMEKINKE